MKRLVLPFIVSLMGFCGSAQAAGPIVSGCGIPKPGPTWVATRIEISNFGGFCSPGVTFYNYQDTDPAHYFQNEAIAVCKKGDVDTANWQFLGQQASGWGTDGPCMYKNSFNQPIHGDIYYFKRL